MKIIIDQAVIDQALDFVEDVHLGEWRGPTERQEEVITALRQAIEQAEKQEPVACDGDFPEGFDASYGIPAQALRTANAIMFDVVGKREWDVPCTAGHLLSFVRKNTSPPPSQLLTDEQIASMWREATLKPALTSEFVRSFARAIEAAYGIKGEA